MGFLKSLFGGSKPTATPVAPQMTGTEHSFGALTYQLSRFQDITNQESLQSMSEAARARLVWTQHKENEFLAQFYGENFFFDGEIQSMILLRFHVERDLTGSVSIALYSQTLREIQDHKEKWGERPEPVGALELAFRDGKPMVDVMKFDTAPGTPNKWTNRNKFN